ncbi:MAG: MerR family transcriptional regulator [bacterium]|nr:MerR family transcriptional regulator [bacterium]
MYTVKEISEITGISSHTIRFYDNEGLFPFTKRSKTNVRLFPEEYLEWIHFIHCLRDTGMPLAEIKTYIALAKEGDSTSKERYNMILKQKEKAEQDVINMQKRVALLDKKLDYYKKLEFEGNDDFMNPSNCIFK